MSIFEYMTGVKFRKSGREIKAAIDVRIRELETRLVRRETDLQTVMDNKPMLRSYLVRDKVNDYPHGGQMRAEMPSEEHQRVTELCRRINRIEGEMRQLAVVKENLADDQSLELSFEDITKLGFAERHYGPQA